MGFWLQRVVFRRVIGKDTHLLGLHVFPVYRADCIGVTGKGINILDAPRPLVNDGGAEN